MTKFNFTDRDSYIAFVHNWKAEYKANSETIRRMKADIKAAQKAGSFNEASRLQSSRQYMRRIQREALELRAEAKVESQRQYLAAQEVKAAA